MAKIVGILCTKHTEIFLSTCDKHALINTFKARERSCPFIAPGIKALMNERDQLHRALRKTCNHHDWLSFRAARNSTKAALVEKHREHVLKEVQQHRNKIGSLLKVIKENIAYRVR